MCTFNVIRIDKFFITLVGYEQFYVEICRSSYVSYVYMCTLAYYVHKSF